MPGVRQASNVVQKIPTIDIKGRVVLQPHTWYTCPAGKKAIVKGSANSTGTGAAANTTLQIGGVTVRRVLAAGGSADPWQRDLAPDVVFNFKGQLDAGDIVQTIQNSGTNAEWELIAEVHETPA